MRDQGRAWPPALRERVFEPFFTTRAGGNGLGLAVANAWRSSTAAASAFSMAPGGVVRFEFPRSRVVGHASERSSRRRRVRLYCRGCGGAFVCFFSLTPRSSDLPNLAEADRHYRAGIGLLGAGTWRRRARSCTADRARADRSRALPAAGARLPRSRADPRARSSSIESISRTSPGADAEAAAELAALDADLDVLIDPTSAVAVRCSGRGCSASRVWRYRWTRARARRRSLSFDRLCDDNPELQPAIAYLVGCLRHELFKHRILAVGDAVHAWRAARAAAGPARVPAGASLRRRAARAGVGGPPGQLHSRARAALRSLAPRPGVARGGTRDLRRWRASRSRSCAKIAMRRRGSSAPGRRWRRSIGGSGRGCAA